MSAVGGSEDDAAPVSGREANQGKDGPAEAGSDEPLVYTIGHSTRPIEAFIDLLRENGVDEVVDVRTVPRSRHNPQFDRAQLPASLEGAGIGYRHVPELGGLRHAHADSPNMGWRNASFRGYADYMQTPAFGEAVDELVAAAAERTLALMCAEAVPWRCHRSLIGDALLVRGVRVIDILGPGQRRPHGLTSFARVEGRHVDYPPAAGTAPSR